MFARARAVMSSLNDSRPPFETGSLSSTAAADQSRMSTSVKTETHGDGSRSSGYPRSRSRERSHIDVGVRPLGRALLAGLATGVDSLERGSRRGGGLADSRHVRRRRPLDDHARGRAGWVRRLSSGRPAVAGGGRAALGLARNAGLDPRGRCPGGARLHAGPPTQAGEREVPYEAASLILGTVALLRALVAMPASAAGPSATSSPA